jgi:hypothetical protein
LEPTTRDVARVWDEPLLEVASDQATLLVEVEQPVWAVVRALLL